MHETIHTKLSKFCSDSSVCYSSWVIGFKLNRRCAPISSADSTEILRQYITIHQTKCTLLLWFCLVWQAKPSKFGWTFSFGHLHITAVKPYCTSILYLWYYYKLWSYVHWTCDWLVNKNYLSFGNFTTAVLGCLIISIGGLAFSSARWEH